MDIGIESGTRKTKGSINKTAKLILWLMIFVFVVCFFVVLRVQTKYYSRIVSGEKLSPPNIGVVFGAGLRAGGEPSDILADRISTAINLYQNGRIGKFIMSGDEDNLESHNEVSAMRDFAIAQGLPENAILLDGAGFRTYDSCKRISEGFGINSAILITQKYHLRRALYICNELGIDAIGVAARDSGYRDQLKFSLREFLASMYAWVEVKVN
jgi:vancomycin permeability regulator SanA